VRRVMAVAQGVEVAAAVPEANNTFEMAQVFKPMVILLSHLGVEEFIMLLCFVVPAFLGLSATLRVLTGVTKSGLDAQADLESGELGAVAGIVHKDVEESTTAMQAGMNKVESKIVDLQRAHDARFADLHKDLAGIVWELSKLRADMARWQVRPPALTSRRALSPRAPLPSPVRLSALSPSRSPCPGTTGTGAARREGEGEARGGRHAGGGEGHLRVVGWVFGQLRRSRWRRRWRGQQRRRSRRRLWRSARVAW
jgi:hypothetical protein